MEGAAEDPADLENNDSEQTTPDDGRKKNLALKLQRLKMKGLCMQRSYTPSMNMAAVYELRIKKLRRNNRSLARALADQKIETQQWYSEVVSLKGQLQDANERLLRPLDNNSENLIEQEVERRFKEIGEPLNAAISQAMENLLVVVENFSKVKQLANVRSSISRSSSSSSFSFPRSSGLRAPLGSCVNPSSPCQSVRPMVSGHVLQPAMVAIQKLDDVWKARLKERIQEREGEMNMSTIGENSVASAGEENDSISQNDTLSTLQQTTEDPSGSVSESATESLSPKSPSRGGLTRRGRRSLENRRGPSKSPVVKDYLPVSSASPVMSKTGEERFEVSNSTHLEHIEDPLEGPSWWYADSSSGRGRGRGKSRGRGRGRKRGHSRSDHGSPITRVNCSIEASSESEEEESFRKRSKSHVNDDIRINNDSAVLSDVSKQILEHSYLSSPKTMLAKLEDLEAKSGRRSKSKSKGRSLRISESIPDNVQNQPQHNLAGIGKNTIVAHDDDIVATTSSGASSMANKSQSHIDPKAFEDSSENMPESIGSDFLIKDSDLTCIGDISMDITEPITKILSQASAEMKRGPSKNNVNDTEIKRANSKDDVNKNDKKFFKNETTSCLQKSSETARTPFDLSLMDDTYITIPPYSSQKNVEKENMPPDSSTIDPKNDEGENYDLNLRRVSIVLKDIMKSSESMNMMHDDAVMSPTAEDEMKSNETTNTNGGRNSILEHNKHNSRSKRNICFSVKTVATEADAEDEDELWTPEKKKRKSANKKKKKSSNSKKSSSDRLSVPKKQTKRKAKSELIVPTTEQICEVMEKDVENSLSRTNNETKILGTVTDVFDSIDDNDPKTLINDCYVKICRTLHTEGHKTIASVDDTCILLNEDSLPDFGLLYRKISTKDTTCVSGNSSCLKSDKKMEVTEKVPVDCGVLGTTIEACQELEPDQAENSGPDHIVPDEAEVVCLETGSDNGESMNLSDPAIIEKADDLPVSTPERIDITRMEKNTDIVEMEAPRKRRAALKITSFKEPNLSKKMRRVEDSSVVGTSAPSKAKSNTRSGRKSSCS